MTVREASSIGDTGLQICWPQLYVFYGEILVVIWLL